MGQAESRSTNNAEFVHHHIAHGIISRDIVDFILRVPNHGWKSTLEYLQSAQLSHLCHYPAIDRTESYAHPTSREAPLAILLESPSRCINRTSLKRRIMLCGLEAPLPLSRATKYEDHITRDEGVYARISACVAAAAFHDIYISGACRL